MSLVKVITGSEALLYRLTDLVASFFLKEFLFFSEDECDSNKRSLGGAKWLYDHSRVIPKPPAELDWLYAGYLKCTYSGSVNFQCI